MKAPMPARELAPDDSMKGVYSKSSASVYVKKKASRFIPTTPERILDAPELLNDFYLNVLDWSSHNVLAVGLGQAVYLWNAATGSIDQLCETEIPGDFITSVSWAASGVHLAIGTTEKQVQIWDVDAKKQLRSFNEHISRVTALSWNGHTLTSAGRDTKINNHDVRVRDHLLSTWNYHTQEICGLRWSPDGTQLASGGNDNLVCIWDRDSSQGTPQHVFTEHTAAVKALAWSPHQRSLLATGGGTSDRHIRFWNTITGTCLNAIDTKSQVCGLIWNPHEKEILSSHGYSQNQLTLWKYPSMTPMIELTGHTARILHTALSPNGTVVCSAAGDETLRFWKVFEPLAKTNKSASQARASKFSSKLPRTDIR